MSRVLGAVSPSLGLRRMQAEIKYRQFAYDAARPTTERGYAPQNINPNSFDVQRDRLQLMREGFDLEKNFAPAKALNRKYATFTAPEYYIPRTGDSGLDRAVSEYLCDDQEGWFFNCDLSQEHDFFTMMEFGVMGMNCGGDYGWTPVRPGLPSTEEADSPEKMEEIAAQLPLFIQAVEPDRIGGVYQNVVSETYVAGINLGRWGEPISFRVFRRSPIVSQYTDPVEIPASQFIHLKDGQRKDQLRPAGKFDVTAALLRDLYETLNYMRGKQKLAASFTAFVNSIGEIAGSGTFDAYQTTVGSANNTSNLQKDIYVGQINHLLGGQEIKFPDTETPSGESQFLLIFTMKLIAMGFNLPYSFALDAAELGGVSTRLESQMAKVEFERVQSRVIGPRATRIKNMALLDACAKGILPAKRLKDIVKGHWVYRPHPEPDLGKEASANVSLYNAGLRDPKTFWAEQRQEMDTVAQNFAEWGLARRAALKNAQQIDPEITMDDIFPAGSKDKAGPGGPPQPEEQGQPEQGQPMPEDMPPGKPTPKKFETENEPDYSDDPLYQAVMAVNPWNPDSFPPEFQVEAQGLLDEWYDCDEENEPEIEEQMDILTGRAQDFLIEKSEKSE